MNPSERGMNGKSEGGDGVTKKHNQIVFTEKSPYYLVEVDRIEDENGAPIPAKPVQAFCRCGHSEKKPYCDGTHAKVGMDNSKGDLRHPSRWLKYSGEKLDVFFNPAICCHKGACLKIAPNAFALGRKPWIQPDLDSVELVKQAVEACPSGALYYAEDGVKHIELPDKPLIRIKAEGSMECHHIALMDDLHSADQLLSKTRYVLCTCGKSCNKPFCDGAHREQDETE